MTEQKKARSRKSAMSNRGEEVAQKNTGIPYEQLTCPVFDQVVNADREDLKTIEVFHNVTLQGKYADDPAASAVSLADTVNAASDPRAYLAMRDKLLELIRFL
jgi:hypothetical protein